MCQDSLRKRSRATSEQAVSMNGNTKSNQDVQQSHDGEGYALTRKVVSHHNTFNDAWVIYKGGVYDVTLFLEQHPGGMEVLDAYLGGDVTDVMSAGDGEREGLHVHSAFAYKMLSKYWIGDVVGGDKDGEGKDGNVDDNTGELLVKWDKPILHQVGMLGGKYHRWIHSFPTTDHTVKMFTNDAVEAMTKCPWYVPLLFWLPILAVEWWRFVGKIGGWQELDWGAVVLWGLVGGLCWLLFEYVLHRYVFHLETEGYYANIFHFLIHGHHHITPMDFDRLVFPPVPAMILAAPFWYGAPRILGVHVGYPWLIGFAIGYLVYDMTHFWIHHAVPKNAFLKQQKRRHVHHHYFQPNVNFGISNPLFDVVFGTLKEPER